MTGRLQGKVALITGGASGMGRDTVLRFLDEGAKVMIADLNQENGGKTLAEIEARGQAQSAAFMRCDVSEDSDVQRIVAETERLLGSLDIAFLNAGVGGAFGPIAETTVQEWDFTFAVLVRSVFLGMKHASTAMRRNGRGGAILSTASVAGLYGGAGSHAYSAAKAAVVNLTRNVAVELGPHRIRVNAIAPGAISTPLLHRGRPEKYQAQLTRQPWPETGEGRHIADTALFLCSDEARFITGETVVVDGGLAAQGLSMWGTGRDNPFLRKAGLDQGTTGAGTKVRDVRE
jgi:NAD(P)-dependent dehydrogenase (short-subunit alcohol dehydrogenase family)